MIVVRGHETAYMTRERLVGLLAAYEGVTVDVGAGDGKAAYRLALAQPDRLVIAVEPALRDIAETSGRAAKLPARGGAPNLLCVAEAIEDASQTIARVANEVLVTLPSGGLLRGILEGDRTIIGALSVIGVRLARIKIVLNAGAVGDAAELPAVTPLYTRDIIAPAFAAYRVRVGKARWMDNAEVAKLETTWAKRIARMPDARSFYIEAKVMDASP
jgi:hypothetical protein